ncbi:MAG: hypothetical protein ACO3F2_01415 [Roseiflexaceae bacterium]
MRTCSIIGASLLSLIAVPALAFAVVFYGFAQIVLGSPSFVAKLEPANIEAQIRKAAPYLVASALTNPNDPDNQQLVNDLLPDPAMRAMVTTLMPMLLEVTNGDLSSASLAQLDSHITQIIAQAPPCSAEVEAAYAQAIAGTGTLPGELCRPSDAVLALKMATRLADELRQLFDGIAQAPLTTPDGDTALSPQLMSQDITASIAAVRANAGQGFILPLTLIVLILALAVRSLRELLGWSGGILLFAGLIGLGVAFASGSLLAIDWQSTFRQELQGPELNLALIVFELFDTDAFGPLVSWINTVNGGMAIGGLVAMIASAFLPRPVRLATAPVGADPSVGAIPTMPGGAQMQDPGATQPIPTGDGERKE